MSADAPVRTGTTPPAAPPPTRRSKSRVDTAFYVMLLPALALFTVLIVGPALAGMFFSVTNYVGYGEYSFIGLNNFLVLFTDPRILTSYGFTIGFSIVTVLLVNALGLLLAVGLNAKIRFKTALRGVFFVPMVVSGIVIAYVFNYIFSNSLPAVFTSLGIDAWGTSILANPSWAWVGVVIVTAWQAIPSALIIYLAGLLAIPEEVYEASSLDGASPWRQFTAITLPLVAGYVVINTVLGFKNFLNAYDIIVGLTDGGPGTSTYSVAMTIFTGFQTGDYAYQMANAVVFFVITVLISLAQLRLINGRGVSL
ncbi:carbohydrate ABC transporter permease [Quadrisphaera sp. INWT6]|uniref:carbohydrate ABC transporter permease n=1 Tax=Quadrisphaera sp. INWT6 TaxID=2596917 RepID=UPI0018925DC8|nr:sugar ABC transporter permease [Quadrisphaera sp. INWT6]MBF5082970.1 sugar ABC transporter permease [Quadrisphaera sp. INWT6]